jgi:AMP deaminase
LQKCLELRDKYMSKSLQRLGDDPRDHDGHFQPFSEHYADVSGVRPDSPLPPKTKPSTENFEPWKIYPEPPPPHWHWKDEIIVSADGTTRQGDEFDFEACAIPGLHQGWSFSLDETGIYQVYDEETGSHFKQVLIVP